MKLPDGMVIEVVNMSNDMIRFPEDLRRFVDGKTWTFAKTMPKWPHEFLVRERVNEALFQWLVIHIRTKGYEGRFYKMKITYYEEDGMLYWTMGAPLDETTIINRCKVEDSYEYRLKKGTLPKG